MRYRYPRARGGEEPLRVVLDTTSLVRLEQPELERLSLLVEFDREPGLLFWRTPENPGFQLPSILEDVRLLSYDPPHPESRSEFTVEMSYANVEESALGYSRWDNEVLDEIFGAPTTSSKYNFLRDSLLALEASEAVSSALFVTSNEDILVHRDWLQDRMPVFIVGITEALYFLDVSLKRRGIYAYRPSSHVIGEQGYYFQRVCNTIPNFPPAWTTSLVGESELPSGRAVQRYLESFHLRLVTMFEIKDRIADQFYRPANNTTQYRMLRELNMFFPLATGSFDSLAWACRYIYQFRSQNSEGDWDLRRRVILRLQLGQSNNGLIAKIEQSNKQLGELLRSGSVQKLLAIFYPARDSIQHRHPLPGVQYTWIEDRGHGIVPSQAYEKACSLAVLDEDTAGAIIAVDQEDPSDYFSEWGIRISGSTKLLEPHKFVGKALMELCTFYDEFFKYLKLESHPSLSHVTRQNVLAVEQERQQQGRRDFHIPFFLDKDVKRISGGLAQIATLRSSHEAGRQASDTRSQALYGSYTMLVDIARIERG